MTETATQPTDISARGWVEVLKRTWKEAGADNIGLAAAGVAFYAFLSFVPLLGALVLVYGIAADPMTVADHVRGLTEMLPADAARLIGEQLTAVSRAEGGKTGFGLLLALGLALYGAMRGATATVTALTQVYDAEETRGFVETTLLALALTVGALVALLLAILGISVLAAVEALLPFSSPAVHLLLQIGFWILAAAAISAGIALVYRYAPNRPKARWAWLTPGSILATLLWIAASLGFAFYVRQFGSYNATYGSLGAVVVMLTWLYLIAYVLLLGGELNSELERQTAAETTER